MVPPERQHMAFIAAAAVNRHEKPRKAWGVEEKVRRVSQVTNCRKREHRKKNKKNPRLFWQRLEADPRDENS